MHIAEQGVAGQLLILVTVPLLPQMQVSIHCCPLHQQLFSEDTQMPPTINATENALPQLFLTCVCCTGCMNSSLLSCRTTAWPPCSMCTSHLSDHMCMMTRTIRRTQRLTACTSCSSNLWLPAGAAAPCPCTFWYSCIRASRWEAARYLPQLWQMCLMAVAAAPALSECSKAVHTESIGLQRNHEQRKLCDAQNQPVQRQPTEVAYT